MKYAIQQMRLGKSIKYIDTHMNSPFHHFRQFVLEGIQELLIGRSQNFKNLFDGCSNSGIPFYK